MTDLPPSIASLVLELAELRGAVAVVLGGSRANGTAEAESDWDLGLYYRGDIELAPLSAHGTVHRPGSWGRLMNGGAWLKLGEHRVDVLLRDLDAVEHWTRRAGEGEFDVDALLGYLAGAPTYLLAAELASCRVLHGLLPTCPYPEKLKAAGAPRWRFCRSFSVAYARTQAKKGNVAAAVGQMAKAVMEEAHARMCERGEWVCNEKQLVEAAGLGETQALFSKAPGDGAELVAWMDRVAAQIGVAADEASPWDAA